MTLEEAQAMRESGWDDELGKHDPRPPTGSLFAADLARDLENPGFRREFERVSQEIAATDARRKARLTGPRHEPRLLVARRLRHRALHPPQAHRD